MAVVIDVSPVMVRRGVGSRLRGCGQGACRHDSEEDFMDGFHFMDAVFGESNQSGVHRRGAHAAPVK
jgi:hypothetical protein